MLELVLAVRDRLQNGNELARWAADHSQPVPKVMVGYRKPRSADDWPFVSLVAGFSDIQLGNQNKGRVAVHLVSGVMMNDIDDSGYLAVNRLDMAALREICLGGGLGGSDWNAIPVETRLLDIDLSHPNFEIERAVIFSIVIQ